MLDSIRKGNHLWMPLLLLFNTAHSQGRDPQVATLVQVEGQVQVYHHPSDRMPPPEERKGGTLALYEGRYYRVAQANSGDRIEKDNLVRTLPGARAKIIYDNGDQIYLGTATAYMVTWKDEGDRLAKLNLMYGKLRAVISKEGPRKKLQIRTRAATMGVRGTDFFIDDSGGATVVSVIRGGVELTPSEGGKSERVGTGRSALVEGGEGRGIRLRTTHQGDLAGIEEASSMGNPAEKALSPSLAALEKQAVRVTVRDIEIYQPEVFRSLPKELRQASSAAELNARVIREAARMAPPAPPKKKPSLRELKESDSPGSRDEYDLYFKPVK
ncbi:hypothetical protein EB061_10930 [bacterium]|nr:hypothetical protein [bacterium]